MPIVGWGANEASRRPAAVIEDAHEPFEPTQQSSRPEGQPIPWSASLHASTSQPAGRQPSRSSVIGCVHGPLTTYQRFVPARAQSRECTLTRWLARWAPLSHSASIRLSARNHHQRAGWQIGASTRTAQLVVFSSRPAGNGWSGGRKTAAGPAGLDATFNQRASQPASLRTDDPPACGRAGGQRDRRLGRRPKGKSDFGPRSGALSGPNERPPDRLIGVI